MPANTHREMKNTPRNTRPKTDCRRKKAANARTGRTEFFGMLFSVAFGILLVPGLYALFQTWRENVKRFFAYVGAKAVRKRELKEMKVVS